MANPNVTVSAVPFNPQTQTFGATPTQTNQYSMGSVNINSPAQKSVSVMSYKDNPNGTTTNYLSDGTTSTVNYTKNSDGSLTPKEIPQSQNISTFGTQPIKLTSGSQQTSTQPTSNYALSGLQNIPTPVSDAASGISQTMLQLLPQLQGQAQELTNQKQALGVDAMRTNLQNLNNQILQKQAELSQQDVALAQGIQNIEDQTIPMQFITGQQMSLEKRANLAKAVKVSQINMLNASALAAQGNIALANDMAQQAVDTKFAPFKEMYTLLQEQLKAIQPLLSSEDKKVAAQQSMMADVQKQLLTIKADHQKNIANLLMQSQANGIDQGTYSKALNAYNNGASDIEVASIIGAYGGKDYLANKDILDTIRNQNFTSVGQLTIDNGYDLETHKKGIAAGETGGSRDMYGGNNPYKVLDGQKTYAQYQAMTPQQKANTAYGKYQVMGYNIPTWTEEAGLGRMTIDQFLNSPEAQEKVIEFQATKDYAKYGNWDDVASVWFSGHPLANNYREDKFGTTVPGYLQKYRKNIGVVEQTSIVSPQIKAFSDALDRGEYKDINAIPEKYQAQVALYRTGEGNKINPKYAQKIQEQLTNLTNATTLIGGFAGIGGANIAGSNFLGRTDLGTFFSGDKAETLGYIDNVLSATTLQELIKAKEAGATFGALSIPELKMLENSANVLNKWAIRDEVTNELQGFKVSDEVVNKELKKLKDGLMKELGDSANTTTLNPVADDIYNMQLNMMTSTPKYQIF